MFYEGLEAVGEDSVAAIPHDEDDSGVGVNLVGQADGLAVAKAFPTDAAVNEALKLLMRAVEKTQPELLAQLHT